MDCPRKVLIFQMESHVMRNRLRVRFWGLHLTADGVIGIAAALVIVFALLLTLRL